MYCPTIPLIIDTHKARSLFSLKAIKHANNKTVNEISNVEKYLTAATFALKQQLFQVRSGSASSFATCLTN